MNEKQNEMKFAALGLAVLLTACASAPETPYTMEAVRQLIRAHASDFVRCENGKTPRSGGTINVAFDIEPDGKVSNATIDQSTLNQPKVENCVLETFRMIQFAPNQRGDLVHVDYPYPIER